MATAEPSLPAPSGRPLSLLLALLIMCVALPVVLLTAWLISSIGDLDRSRASHYALQMVRGVTADLDRDFHRNVSTMRALASSPALADGDLQAFFNQAYDIHKSTKLHILLRSLDGRQLLNTRVPIGTALPNSPFSASDQSALTTQQPTLSDLVVGAVAKSWVLGLSIPVIVDGKPQYLLTTSIEPDYIFGILSSTPRDPGWIIAVSDSAGRLIARSAEHDAHVGLMIHPDVRKWSEGGEGVLRTLALAGHEVLRGYKWSQSSGWLVGAFVPLHVIQAPLHRLWRLLALVAITLAAIAVPLIIFLGRQISEPIVAAAKSAKRLGRGEIIEPIDSHLREANNLSRALAAASHDLQERGRALAENEARFRSVFEQSAVGFEQVALDGRIVDVNARLCAMLGYTREECLEKTFKTLTHPDDWASEDELIAGLLRNEKPHYEIEKRFITKAGDPIWVRVTSSLVRDANGQAVHRISVVEDVTERRKARETAARLAAIVQASADAVLSCRPSGTIETWNPGAAKLFGYTADEIVGRPVSQINPADKMAELDGSIAAVMRGETISIDTVRQHKDGSPIDVALTAVPIMTAGWVTSISITMHDIRERKRHDTHISLLNRELAHRVKNTLAVVQSIANQTMRSSPQPEAFRVAFQGRLQALAAANDLLMETSWAGAELEGFMDKQLAPLMPRSSRQLHKRGPAVIVPAELSIPLGLALHELGTNAIKYGAWSASGGQVDLSWELKEATEGEETRLIVTWRERFGPPPVPSTRRGFGSTLIERGIPGAVVERRFDPEGLFCRLDLPIPPK